MVTNAHAPLRTRSWLSVYKMSQILSVQVCCAQISVVLAPCPVYELYTRHSWSGRGPMLPSTGQEWPDLEQGGIIELSADWGFMTKCQIF